MGFDSVTPVDNDELTRTEVADSIKKWTGQSPVERSNGPRFYAQFKKGKPKRGTLFAAVTPGPRLYFDPTAKACVYSQETPARIRDHPDVEKAEALGHFLKYSIMLENEIPDIARYAVEWSYGRFTSTK